MSRKHPKYIAWIDHTSVATGDDVNELKQKAQAIIMTLLWRQENAGNTHKVRITTYGQQREVDAIFVQTPGS